MNTRLNEYNERRRLAGKRAKAVPVKRQPIPLESREKLHALPCRVCQRRPVEIHHIVPRSAFAKTAPDVHDLANLMPLCQGCHVDHHTRGSAARVPRYMLTLAELEFAYAHQTAAWMDAWYPEGDTS